MRLNIWVVASVVLLLSEAVIAQPPPPPPPPGPAPNIPVPRSREEAEPAPKKAEGDIVYFTNGKTLEGIQVLRENASFVMVETIRGQDPLSLPKKLVERVEYDDIDPNKRPSPAEAAAMEAAALIIGDRASPELSAKLTKAFTDEAIEYEDKDYVEALGELASRAQVELAFSDGIQARPPARRLWSANVAPGATLLSVLNDQFAPRYPGIRVVYQLNRVLITTPQESPESGEGGAGQAQPAPGAPGLPQAAPAAPQVAPATGGRPPLAL